MRMAEMSSAVLGMQLQGETDGSLRMDLRRKKLEARGRDAEWLTPPASCSRATGWPTPGPRVHVGVNGSAGPVMPSCAVERQDACPGGACRSASLHIDNSPVGVTPREGWGQWPMTGHGS